MLFKEFQDIVSWGYLQIVSKGQNRNDGSAANTHPGRVTRILKEKNLIHRDNDKQDFMYSIVGFFHDMIEDEEATYEEIERIAGKEVADAVQILSKDKKLKDNEGYMEIYISKIAESELTRLVKIADRIENIRDFVGLKNKREYVEETEKWFIDLAKGTVFEQDLHIALENLKKIIEKEDEQLEERMMAEDIR